MNIGIFSLLCPLVAGGPVATADHAPPAMHSFVPQPGMGQPIPAPLLATRVIAPEGVRVAAYPGTPMAKSFDAPTSLAFRPGYIYRLELSNLPYAPGQTLYPEVEVRGVLVPRPGMKYMDFPTPIHFSAVDIERVLNGAFITKVIYLEDPEKALPVATLPNRPVEFPAGSEKEAIRAAIDNGRLVAIVRLGNRPPDPELLTTMAVPGTVLMPGEQHLKAPALPPILPWLATTLYDPMMGPKGPKEECILDGGNKGVPLGIGANNRLHGLDATDVGVEYSVGDRRKVTTSNVVCICSPRFMVQRVEVIPGGVNVPIHVVANSGAIVPYGARERLIPKAEISREKPVSFASRERPSAYLGKVSLGFTIGSSRPSILAKLEGVQIKAAVVEPELLTGPFLCPLTVSKSVDPSGPVPIGEIVTFTIRYRNTGSKPVSDLVVSDSLSGRLEYIVGSADTDRAANFTAIDNEAGSVVVRWEIPGELLPGQSGVVKFKARVR
jgi:uncharacterized repeat protein (TIGR01451 family)